MAAWTIGKEINEFSVYGQGLFTGEWTQVLVRKSTYAGIRIHWQNQLLLWGVGVSLRSLVCTEARTTCLLINEKKLWCVEHFCAAMSLFLHEDLEIWIDGNEIPFLDGSAWIWYDLLKNHLLLNSRLHYLPIKKDISCVRDYGYLRILPQMSFCLSFQIKSPSGFQAEIHLENLETEIESILQARSFIDLASWQIAQATQMMPGATENSGIIYTFENKLSIVHGAPLRSPDELIKHKILDFMGDMALYGGVPRGFIQAQNSGHRMHCEILQKL